MTAVGRQASGEGHDGRPARAVPGAGADLRGPAPHAAGRGACAATRHQTRHDVQRGLGEEPGERDWGKVRRFGFKPGGMI